MTRQEIFQKIQAERDYQDQKWGTEFDDQNTINDWVAYINQYASKATAEDTSGNMVVYLIKVAALALAAIEAHERNKGFALRHYDDNQANQ